MGAANSSIATSSSSSSLHSDGITTVSQRVEGADPFVERLGSLTIATPLLKSPPQPEGTLADILVRRPPANSSVSGDLNHKALLELFSFYRDWLEQRTRRISEKQEEIESKIELADALAMKLLQRYNYSVSAMRTTTYNLSQVHSLEVDVGVLKGRLTEVINNCDALCRRMAKEYDILGPSIPPISSADVQLVPPSSEASEPSSL